MAAAEHSRTAGVAAAAARLAADQATAEFEVQLRGARDWDQVRPHCTTAGNQAAAAEDAQAAAEEALDAARDAAQAARDAAQAARDAAQATRDAAQAGQNAVLIELMQRISLRI